MKEVGRNSDTKDLIKNELFFYDDIDWDYHEGKAAWVDVTLSTKDKSLGCWAFTLHGYAGFWELDDQSPIPGSIPESFFIPGVGWELFVHKELFTQEDVKEACIKWVKLVTRGHWMGWNIYYNDQRCGHAYGYSDYPRELDSYLWKLKTRAKEKDKEAHGTIHM